MPQPLLRTPRRLEHCLSIFFPFLLPLPPVLSV